MGGHVPVSSWVYEGAVGHHEALPMVQQTGLPVMAKLRHDAALSCPDEGPYAGGGQRRKDGTKRDDRHLPAASLPASSLEEGLQTKI